MHTKGPWKVSPSLYEDNRYAKVWGAPDSTFFAMVGGECRESNARLIASAPLLLEACKAAIGYRSQTHHGDDPCLVMLRAAIAKVEGR